MSLPALRFILACALLTTPLLAGCMARLPTAEPLEPAGAAEGPAEDPPDGTGSDATPDDREQSPGANETAEEEEREPSSGEPGYEEPAGDADDKEENVTPPRPDYNATHEGWVTMTGPDPFVVEYTLPVDVGARTAALTAEIISNYPGLGRLPRETANLTLTLLNPAGEPVATAHRDLTSEAPGATLQIPEPEPGLYKARITIYGGSDGNETGDKYVAELRVDYGA